MLAFARAQAAQLQDMTKETEERLVRTTFRKVMFMHTKRLPARRADIKEELNRAGADWAPAVVDHVIRQTQARFESICGFRMVEVNGASAPLWLANVSSCPVGLTARRTVMPRQRQQELHATGVRRAAQTDID